jgi:hypothetical protein
VTDDPELILRPEDEVRWWRERGERELRQVLYWRWDPLGVQDALPYSEGEYDEYAPRVASALQEGASAREIEALLSSIEEAEIGVGSGPHKAVADLIVDWYQNSRSYWCEFDRDR